MTNDQTSNPVQIGPVRIGKDCPLALIAGPCVMEPDGMTQRIARHLAELCGSMGVPLIFKASFDKANRTSGSSFRGPGLVEGMRIFDQIKSETGLPVTTDVHETIQAQPIAEVVDLLQIPAFLARQTDLLEAAAGTGRPVNVKKGQFMAPWEMNQVVIKLTQGGCRRGAADRARYDVRLRPAGQRLPGHSADAVNRRAGGLRRNAFGPTARWRARRHGLLRPARDDSHPGPRGRRRRLRRPVSRSSPGPGPSPVRRPELLAAGRLADSARDLSPDSGGRYGVRSTGRGTRNRQASPRTVHPILAEPSRGIGRKVRNR